MQTLRRSTAGRAIAGYKLNKTFRVARRPRAFDR
jgi:hypothetical protein